MSGPENSETGSGSKEREGDEQPRSEKDERAEPPPEKKDLVKTIELGDTPLPMRMEEDE